jgi:ATP-dependent DNA helicase RecG
MGLAQLHQLRGRVGRGAVKSQCILLYESKLSETAKQRLKVIAATNDGFEIARQDLLIRGPGELLGQRQSGLPALRFANLETDLAILHNARDIAPQLVREHPQLARQLVELWFHKKQIYAGT